MNMGELIELYREEAVDKVRPYLCSNELLFRFATEAERETCRRSHLLVDSTSSICSIPVSANDPLIDIDPAIINIRRAKLSTSAYSLTPIRAEEMDRVNPGWEKHVGTPTTYVTNYQTNAIRLYPIQQVSADLNMTVSRLPFKAMQSEEDEPEIREEYHPALVKWMLYRAYSRQDADMFDPQKAAMALADFEREFGKKASGRNARWQEDRVNIDTPTIA